MKRYTIMKQGRRVVLTACTLLIGTQVLITSCKDDDVLTGQPSWLGNSIYERLQEDGDYTTVLRLIDDLGQHEVLSHTGSKTLFAANDSAYDAWFKDNNWGVKGYSDLTVPQKKLLLNNSMINNAYLIELMSNVSGNPPMEGMAMRRETASSIYDSVAVMTPEQMPKTSAWDELRGRGKNIHIFKDGTSAPMIHFLPAFMRYYKITDADLAMLTNQKAKSVSEAWVNGKKVLERDITCKNGYIHKVDGVIESSPNMAEILRQHPQMSMWSGLIDRFSAPYYHAEGTREYNRINNTQDSIFTLRYYSRRSLGGERNDMTPDGRNISDLELLPFDPGWNHYMYSNTMGYDLHYDAGAMLVPTNEALTAWWNNEGRDLQDEYKEWDSIPQKTLAKLLKVNMLPTFTESVPSKFNLVLNDAKESLGITVQDVDSCFMGCNGVVYMVNKVFTPAEYASVAYPALAHESTMNIIYWGIDQRNFLPYLLSMDSKYAMLLPSNNAMLYYIDPATYGKSVKSTDGNGDPIDLEAPHLIEFRYDKDKETVMASRYNCYVYPDGTIEKRARQQREIDTDVLNTMMDDLMNQLIIVIPDKSKRVEDYIRAGYNYFKTKGGSLIRASFDNNGKVAFEGGWQIEHNNHSIPTVAEFEKTNGVSYMLDEQMPLGAQKSLYMTMQEHPEYASFMGLLTNDYNKDMLQDKLSNTYAAGNADKGNVNLRLFDNYNYTVYIPTNESIIDLQTRGILPSLEDLEIENERGDSKLDSICIAEGWPTDDKSQAKIDTIMRNIVADFVRYHVQDNSLAVGMAHDETRSDNNYESMKRNPETGRFFPITVNYDATSMTITDVKGNVRHVVTTDAALYNNIVREYWFRGTTDVNSSTYTQRIFMASNAVVHLIDKPLFYEDLKPWRQVVREALNLQ